MDKMLMRKSKDGRLLLLACPSPTLKGRLALGRVPCDFKNWHIAVRTQNFQHPSCIDLHLEGRTYCRMGLAPLRLVCDGRGAIAHIRVSLPWRHGFLAAILARGIIRRPHPTTCNWRRLRCNRQASVLSTAKTPDSGRNCWNDARY